MKTKDLITQLGSDLPPVEPLPSPGRRASRWLVGCVVYLAAMALAVTAIGSHQGGFAPGFVGTQALGVVAGSLAAWAAFGSVVPGYSRGVLIAALLAAVVWLASFAVLATGSGFESTTAEAQHEWVCVAIILLGSTPLYLALLVMLRKGAPMNPMRSGLLIALAAGLLANFTACISLPHADTPTAFLWHVGALGALILLWLPGSRSVLRWRIR